jgi:hypothetical protein
MAAIISSVSTLSAPCLGYLLHAFVKTKTLRAFKKGDKFTCTWEFDDDPNRRIVDEVKVVSTWRGEIDCIGNVVLNGEIKQYRLTGRLHNYCITFEFLGTQNGQHDETAGVIILKRTGPNIDKFEGTWAQLNISGELIGGSVNWKRKA